MIRRAIEEEIAIHFLSYQAGDATAGTIARAAYQGDEEKAERRLRALVADGQLHAIQIYAPEPPLITEPLFTLDETFDPMAEDWPATCKRISNAARNRWKSYPKLITVFRASKKTAARIGGMGNDRPVDVRTLELKIRHDLAYAEAVANLFVGPRHPDAEQLYAEQIYERDLPRRKGEKLPDGLILDAEDKTVVLAIESLGVGYPPALIDSKSRFFARWKNWPAILV